MEIYGKQKLISLEIYNDAGEYITTLDNLQDTYLYNIDKEIFIALNDTFVCEQLVKFLIGDNKPFIPFNSDCSSIDLKEIGCYSYQNCKIVAKTEFKNHNIQGRYQICTLTMPNALFPADIGFINEEIGYSTLGNVIKIHISQEKGHIFVSS